MKITIVGLGYEPALNEPTFFDSKVVNDLEQFKAESDVIMANRMTDDQRDPWTRFAAGNCLDMIIFCNNGLETFGKLYFDKYLKFT